VEKVFRVETSASPAELFEIVNDLETFPQWIELVHRVNPAESADSIDSPPTEHATALEGEVGAGQGQPTWWVVLRAQLGPLARSKRLRMRRTVSTPPRDGSPGQVRFERAETDGRDHAEWTMEVTVGAVDSAGPADAGGPIRSWARCRLYYGGGLWSGLLDGQLDVVADRSTIRLRELAAAAA
jgi:hypothetical protein